MSYGVMEVAGYRKSQEILKNRIYIVYSLYLFGLTAAYLVVSLSISKIGLYPLLVISFVFMAITKLISDDKFRGVYWVVLIACLASLALPGGNKKLFDFVQPHFLQSGFGKIDLKNNKSSIIYEGWDRASHLTLVSTDTTLFGTYDSMTVPWGIPKSATPYFEGDLRGAPYKLLPPQAEILIIGTGGGRDIAYALEQNVKQIFAVEVRDKLVELLKGPFAMQSRGVYTRPNVEAITMDGRKYIETTDKKFDLIFMSGADILMINTKTMFDASEHINTYDSFKTMKDRLKPGGILAICRSKNSDPNLLSFDQFFNSFDKLNLFPVGLTSKRNHIVLGFNIESEALRPSSEKFGDLQIEKIVLKNEHSELPLVRDDKPFMAGAIASMIPIRAVKIYMYFQMLIFLAVSLLFWKIFSTKSSLERWPVKNKNIIMIAGILTGVNFLALEYHVIFVLLRSLGQPFDAIFIGTIVFLFLAGVGSAVGDKGFGKIESAVALIFLAASFIAFKTHHTTLHLLLFAPVMFLTGRFFPAVFGTVKGRMLRVFAMDSIGAFLATMLAAFIPVIWGFTAYLIVSSAIFVVTLALASYAKRIPED